MRSVHALIQKCANGPQCLVGDLEFPKAVDEPMRYSHPNFQPGVNTRGYGALYIAAGVVQQPLLISHMNANCRQSRHIPIKR
jgi:hypothetical protein